MLHQVILHDILWVEAFADYIKIYTENNMLIALSTMKAMEAKLPDTIFARVHRSYIVNLKKIDNIDLSSVHIGSKCIPIGNIHRESLMKKVNLL